MPPSHIVPFLPRSGVLGEKSPGEVLVRLILGADEEAHMRLGTNFILDGDLAERLAEVEGIENVALEPVRSRANLKLVA